MTNWVISASYGELVLKGKNRRTFVDNAEKHILRALKDCRVLQSFHDRGKFFVTVPEEERDRAAEAMRRVFGLVYVTPSLQVEATKEEIRKAACYFVEERLAKEPERKEAIPFKMLAKRSNKQFPMTSPELAAEIGGDLLERYPQLTLDLHHPEFTVTVEIRDHAFVYSDRLHGLGGLPAGSGGRGLLLLSGGIDSPVAGFDIARRGLALGCLHFHSYPFTSERAQNKALRLAEKLSEWTGPMRVYMVNLAETYKAINQHCHSKNTTVLSRRMMMRIGDRICQEYGYDALVTGESLGQVASQTIQGISVVNQVADHPILRPLISRDKTEIIEMARKLDTYETSIEPFDDCCSLFAPDHPNTKPRLHDLEKDEENLDVEELLKQALSTLKMVDIR